MSDKKEKKWKPQKEVPLHGVKTTYHSGKAYSWWNKEMVARADKALRRMLKRERELFKLYDGAVKLARQMSQKPSERDVRRAAELKEEIFILKVLMGKKAKG